MTATKMRVEQIEHRRFARVPLSMRATYRTRDGRNGTLDLRNVGVGGLGGLVDATLEAATPVVVLVGHAGGLWAPVELVGRVSWQVESRAGRPTGIQLLDDESEAPAGLDVLIGAALRQAQEEDSSAMNEVSGVAVMKGAGNVWTIRFQSTGTRR